MREKRRLLSMSSFFHFEHEKRSKSQQKKTEKSPAKNQEQNTSQIENNVIFTFATFFLCEFLYGISRTIFAMLWSRQLLELVERVFVKLWSKHYDFLFLIFMTVWLILNMCKCGQKPWPVWFEIRSWVSRTNRESWSGSKKCKKKIKHEKWSSLKVANLRRF